MKDGEPCTSRGVSTVLEGVTPRPLTKGSMAWRFLPYELYTVMRYLQYSTLQQKNLTHFDSWASTFGCRTDFADIQNKKECGGNRQWQNHYLRNWAANTKGKGII